MKHILTIWWGNWHSSILKWFYNYFKKYDLFENFSITSIVSMSDDGRTTGVLMREMQEKLGIHIPPPWDIRKCSLALSNSNFKDDFEELFESVMNFEGNIIDYSLKEMLNVILNQIQNDISYWEFINYIEKYDSRFLNFSLPLNSPIKGHKFWNILMATLYYNFWDYNKMVNFLCWLLEVKWKILPITTDKAFIFAELWNNELIESQDKISNVANYKAPVNKINLIRNSKEAKLNNWIAEAILGAGYIIIWPWDLYTSIDANFLIEWFNDLVKNSNWKKIYILNSNNKRGETTDYDEIDFIDFIQERVWWKLDLIVANSKELKLSSEERERFLNDISVKWWRYLFINEKKKKEIQKKYDKVWLLLWEYVDRKSLYKNNERMIEDLVEWMGEKE
jgi:uncharacterized cofD-like protein